jgi:hypothetical protein
MYKEMTETSKKEIHDELKSRRNTESANFVLIQYLICPQLYICEAKN